MSARPRVAEPRSESLAEASSEREAYASSDAPPAHFDSQNPAPFPQVPEAGDVLAGRYRIGRVLGAGGHGVVLAAEHVSLGYPVAVKVLHPSYGVDARRRARFHREALLGARLRHRNVVAVLETGDLPGGAPYLVMEHVAGQDLATVLDRAPLALPAAVEVGVQLLAAVAALAEGGVIHRDIKPSNVMLQRSVDGVMEVKLLDFGVSKACASEFSSGALTVDDCVLGTPQYMPPEQVRGEELDVRADLYAVGAVLYECLSGVPPFDGESAGAVMARVLTEQVPPIRARRPDVPSPIAAVIDRSLRKDVASRWPNAAEMSDALRAAAHELGLPRAADAWRARGQPATPRGEETVPFSHSGETRSVLPSSSAPSRDSGRVSQRAPSLDHSLEQELLPRRHPAGALFAVAAIVPLAIGVGVALWASSLVARAGVSGMPEVTVPATALPPRPVTATISTTPRMPEAEVSLDLERPVRLPSSARPAARVTPVTTAVAAGVASAANAIREPATAELERRALSAFLGGRETDAVSLYRRATEIDASRASAWRGLGLASEASGNRDAARVALVRYLELSPRARDREAVLARIHRLGSR